MSEQSNETEIAVLKTQVKTLQDEIAAIRSNFRYGVLALLGVIITGFTKVLGF